MGGFECANGQCLSDALQECDGIAQCLDGTDEYTNCTRNCNGFNCPDALACIALDQVCDDHVDCQDEGDEGAECLVTPSGNSTSSTTEASVESKAATGRMVIGVSSVGLHLMSLLLVVAFRQGLENF